MSGRATWQERGGLRRVVRATWQERGDLIRVVCLRHTKPEKRPTTVIAIHFVKGSPSFFFHSSSCDSSSVSRYSWTKTLQPVVYIFLKEELSSADKEK